MKRTITILTLLAGAVTAHSQGTVNFSDYMGNYSQRFYLSSQYGNTIVSYDGFTIAETVGSTSSGSLIPHEKPVGTTVYSGSLISGTGFDAQLLAAAGLNDSLDQLFPIGTPVHFYTSSSLQGLFQTSGLGLPTSVTSPAIPGTGPNGSATVALAIWDNGGGLYNTLLDAQDAAEIWGISPTGNINQTGGGIIVPPNLPGSMTSFGMGPLLPEPGTISLSLLGAVIILLRRRVVYP